MDVSLATLFADWHIAKAIPDLINDYFLAPQKSSKELVSYIEWCTEIQKTVVELVVDIGYEKSSKKGSPLGGSINPT